MTINTDLSKRIYTGNGVKLDYDYDFKIPLQSDLLVSLFDPAGVEYVQVLDTDYEVTGAGSDGGGQVIFLLAPPASGWTVLLLSNVDTTQPTDFKNQGRFFPETHENSFDRNAILARQNLERFGRTIQVGAEIDGFNGLVSPVVALAPLVFTADGKGIASGDLNMSGDLLLRGNLAASDGSELVGFQQVGTGATPRTLESELRETFKLEQFGAPADGVGNDAPALALAIAAGAKRIQLVAGKSYKFNGTQTISAPLEIVADGANVSLGTGLAAGQNAFLVRTNDFVWSGGNLAAAVRVVAIKIQPNGSTISGFRIDGVNFSGFFYDVFAEGNSGLGHYVKDLNVVNCTGVAPVGINAGHFLAIYSDGVTFADNSVEGGYNTSVYGCQNCSNITITGNREFGVVDTVSDVEAAIQIEGGVGGPSSDSFSIVAGNSVKHDIWISDANEVNVTGNICRRLRLSVGNPGTTGAYRNQYVGNKVAQILCQAFGTPGANDMSADFIANQISANGRTVNGVAIAVAIYVDGPQALNLRFIDNRIMTDASTYACAIARDASMRLYFFNNEFGGRPHSLTSSGGVIYEKNNRNPIFPADCGYIGATPTSDITMALGAWTGFAMGTEQVDANAEFTAASATFTPIETGTYRFKGGVLFNLLASGDDVGVRAYRTSGTPAELRRLGYMQPGAAGFCFLSFCTDLRLTAGDAVQLQYFHSAAGAGSILSGATLTQLQITREA